MKWLELITLLEKFKGRPMINTLILIIALIGGASWANSELVKPLKQMTYSMYTYDTYRMVEFDLNKQREKLVKDSQDIKVADIVKFDYYCNSYFGNEYAKSLSPERKRRIDATCEIISKSYLEEFTKEEMEGVTNFSIERDPTNDVIRVFRES